MKSYSQPIVPPLYFVSHKTGKEAEKCENSSPELPSELLSHCLTTYANWGDLSKLACVQKSWSNIIMDTANQSSVSQWELATALFNGDCGLVKSPQRAIRILKSLSGENVNETTHKASNEEEISEYNEEETRYRTLAIKRVAKCYLEGEGVEQNSDVAVKWMEAAFRIGKDSEVAHDLAIMYEYGRHGVEVDVVAAFEWFERGAEQGNVESMVELGLCYELGCGVEQSDELALDWYTKAAHLGHPTAKFSVAEIFEEARGVPQSDEEACLWYYRAALTGCNDSKLALRRLYDIARIVVPGVTSILTV